MKKIVVLAVSAGLFATSAWAVFVPMTPGQYMKGQVAQGIGQMALAIGALAGKNREITEEVVNTRREFFANAKTAAGPAAAKRFEEALHKRDLHYVTYDIMRDPSAGKLMKFMVDSAGSGQVDGGISPYCYAAYRAWALDLTSNLSALGALDKALDRSMPKFETYRTERNLVEALFFNPHSVLRAENPDAHDYLAAWLIGTKGEKTVAAANATAARIAAQAGPARTAQIVAVLRDWTAVTDQLEGPFLGNPRFVLDPLVAGKVNAQTPSDWTGNNRVFSEIRGRLLAPKVNLAASVDEVQQLWDNARSTRDISALYAAAARRDALVDEIEAVGNRDLEFRYGDKDLVKSMTELNFMFIDRGITAVEADMMIRGEKNPRGDRAAGETRNYLAWNSKLVPVSVAAPPARPVYGAAAASAPAAQAPVAPAGAERRSRRGATEPATTAAVPRPSTPAPAPAARAGAGPVLPDPTAEGVGPFDRAIILVQNLVALKMNPSHLSDRLHIHAKQWDGTFNYGGQDPKTREFYLGKVIEETRAFVRDVRGQADHQTMMLTDRHYQNMSAEQRKEMTERAAALNAICDELEARMVDMRRDMKKPAPHPDGN